ncbi:MAG: hypothetical protein RBT01_09235 [Anaerolineaceae bacterium]|jgi:hypothetical protein|nr:hypothetical protein [Anaerolineaceae bacterium]
MNNHHKEYQQKFIYLGTGITLGASIGMLVGLIFMDGNISLGLIFGACMGLVFGLLIDILGKKIVYSLSGLGMGAILGTILGLLYAAIVAPSNSSGSAGMIFGVPTSNGSWFIGAIGLGTMGFIAGTKMGVDKIQSINSQIE